MKRSEWSVHGIPPPDEAGIKQLYARADLADAYAVRLPNDAVSDPEQLARFLFGQQAHWVTALMRTRDALVAGFGVKTSGHLRRAPESSQGRRIGIFKIYSCNTNEIVMGEDDNHLDFRISVLRQMRPTTTDHAPYVIVSTVVHCHNRFGRAYLKVISPFHRLIVAATLRRAARTGWPLVAMSTIAG